jgi:hypothetical protein
VLVWVFVVRTPPPEQVLLGRWILDTEATNQLQPPDLRRPIPKGRERRRPGHPP